LRNQANLDPTAMDHAAWWLRTLVPLSPFSSLPTRRNPCLLLSPGKRCVVVIIGCDSGLARLAVGRLEELRLPSVFVYAGCLLAENAQALTVAPTVGFQIDVTKRESVQAAMDFLALKEPEGVYCVVNVAGLMAGGPIEWTNEAVFRYEMNVNYFGLRTCRRNRRAALTRRAGEAVNVMQTSLPLLKAWGKGARFVTVTSTIAVMVSARACWHKC
jgi:NAD(P)-dependent dehydrogenase (short-subunit alcohol dehydrogenase family)